MRKIIFLLIAVVCLHTAHAQNAFHDSKVLASYLAGNKINDSLINEVIGRSAGYFMKNDTVDKKLYTFHLGDKLINRINQHLLNNFRDIESIKAFVDAPRSQTDMVFKRSVNFAYDSIVYYKTNIPTITTEIAQPAVSTRS